MMKQKKKLTPAQIVLAVSLLLIGVIWMIVDAIAMS